MFDGILSFDQNTITGTITAEIDLGDLEVTLPGGYLTPERMEQFHRQGFFVIVSPELAC